MNTQAATAPVMSEPFSARQRHAPPSKRALALALAAEGFPVFHLRAGTKDGTPKAWPTIATTDAGTIGKWWPDDTAAGNIGIATGVRYVDGKPRHWAVIDLDEKNGVSGSATLAKLAAEHGDAVPDGFAVRTPSGGSHLYVWTSRPVGTNAGKIGAGIDCRGVGGYVVGPGSVLANGEYTVANDADMVDCPAWLELLLPRPGASAGKPHAGKVAKLPGVDPERARKRAIEYLQNEAPKAIEGAGGDHTTYAVAAELLQFGNDPAATFELMASELWGEGFGWKPEDLQEKIANAAKYMQEPRGSKAPEAVFAAEPVEVDADGEPAALHPLDEVSSDYAVVIAGSDGVVYHERRDLVTGQLVFDRMKLQTFKLALADKTFMVGNHVGPLADAWLKSPRRRFYPGGVVFAPNAKVAADCYNLWGGWAVRPAPGDWSLFKAHILDVVCAGDAAACKYVMGWLATMVQHPGDPGHVALVLKGGRGSGKSTFGVVVGRMLGRHCIHLNDPGQLTGRFSAHLACKVFVLADEATFVGDKASEPRLKAMITEPTIPLEAKGVDIVSVRNTAHLVLCSNDDHVVRAGAKERRYAVLEVSDAVQQDSAYFDRLYTQMNDGGVAAMLHDLLAYDLTGYDVRKLPRTAAAVEQQTDSLAPPERWLFGALNSGKCAGQDWTETPLAVQTSDLYHDYRANKPVREYEIADNAFSRAVQKVFAKGKAALSRRQINRKWHLILPPLSDARRAFNSWLGSTVAWDEVDTDGGGEIGNPADIFA